MKKIILILSLSLLSILRGNEEQKVIIIIGAIVAPWVKGDLCISYWYNQEKIRVCYAIQATQDYLFNIPKRIDHIRVYRTFAKQCKPTPKGNQKCHTVKGRFNTKKAFTELNLTYDHSTITKFYTIPPKQPESIYGYPRRNPSILFDNAQIDNPTAFS